MGQPAGGAPVMYTMSPCNNAGGISKPPRKGIESLCGPVCSKTPTNHITSVSRG